jgi:Domain of unknown function DUF11
VNFTLVFSHVTKPQQPVANIGKPVVFTAAITNSTGSSVPNLSFGAAFTGRFAVVSISANPPVSCTQATLSCALGTMTNGQTTTVTITLIPLFPTHSLAGTATVNALASPQIDAVKVRPLPFHR